MTPHQKEMLVQDFEKYMRHTVEHRVPWTIESFVSFATSLVNFYNGSNLIASSERKQAALLLSRFFNAGIGNRITPDDLDQITDLIISDTTIDYAILDPIFSP